MRVRRTKKPRTALFKETIWPDELMIHAIRFGSAAQAHLSVFFARRGLTFLQFNALRILYIRDPDLEGLPIHEIGERLLARVPDVSRLLDRLEKAHLIERIRGTEDRRVVRVRITDAGRTLVEEIHEPLLQHNTELFAHIPAAKVEKLARALRELADTLPRAAK